MPNIFQLTSSRRGWRCRKLFMQVWWKFQLTSSRRGWRGRKGGETQWKHISTHILTKRMTSFYFFLHFVQSYFNSHPHEEDDSDHKQQHKYNNISTHILTKRMTDEAIATGVRWLFQLTSSRRGWPSHTSIYDDGWIFQLTSSRRGWPVLTFWDVLPLDISTHILTKRMTVCVWCSTCVRFISTHILTKRMTLCKCGEKSEVIFQLTSSRRGWPFSFLRVGCLGYFNSHPHEEDDHCQS